MASASVNRPSCSGTAAGAFRLRPGAWRNGTRGLRTTVSRPSGLELSWMTSAPGALSAVLSPLYSDRRGAKVDPGISHATSNPDSAASSACPRRRLCPDPSSAMPAAAKPSAMSSFSAAEGGSRNSTPITPAAPSPAPTRS